MSALWQADPRLAAALEEICPEDLPPVEPSRDGNFTVRVTIQNPKSKIENSLYLHSRHRPVQEAETWAQSIPCQDKYALVMNGLGLGYHARALFARIPQDALLIVAEPSLPLIKVALQHVDLSEFLANARLMLFTSLDRGRLVDRLEPRSALLTAGAGLLFASPQANLQVAPDFHAAFQKQITEFVAFTRTGFVTLMLNNVTTCRNIANNLGCYATTPPIDLLHNAYAGMPAVLVAAGPSLQKNMHLLKELLGEDECSGSGIRDSGSGADGEQKPGPRTPDPGPRSRRKAVIIAVQTMLKPLLAAGIEPDFVTSLDYNTVSTRFFENLDESGSTNRVHLVAEAKANWNVLDVFKFGGGTMSVAHNDFAEKLLRGTLPQRQALKAGATVAHLSFYLAEFLGCNPIILTGQDLGFVDGLYYKPGTAIHETWGPELGRFNTLETKEWERIVRSRTILRKIPDIHGHPMYTEEQFFTYLQQFERDFAASRHTVIDATEGGAKKQHVTPMTLRDAIDRFCQYPTIESSQRSATRLSQYPIPNTQYPVPLPPWKTWRCDAPANLQRVISALETRRLSAVDMKQTCDTTIPFLEQMVEHQTDVARMNELFVEVDRLRARVGADPATFEMVCFLNTIGELRKFQADLGVKSATDSLDRQKRQLLRDIDYVKNLAIGAQRLLDILDDALARLHRQAAALKTGNPWPREVAGSS